jgi:uncharacterized damage-inducible protein DinB
MGDMMDQTKPKLEMIKMFYDYNSWAMGMLIASLQKLSEEQLTAPGCSGHGSIRDTLAHLLSTQKGWFSWFDKSMTAEESIKLRITSEEIDDPGKLSKTWKSIDRQTDECLNMLSETDVNENWSASLAGGFTITLPLWQLLLHVANHGTHTRAQIVAAIRRFGQEPGIYEFFRFALSRVE